MKYIWRKQLILALLLVIGLTLSAQAASPEKQPVRKSKKKEVKLSTEFGLGVGTRYNMFSIHPASETLTAKMRMPMSYGAALQFRLNIGKHFGIQPEIVYAYSPLKLDDTTNGFSTKIKYSVVQIPVLLSFKVAMFRFNAGPVFTLMDDPSYLLPGEDVPAPLGRLYPTVTYAAGVSVKLGKRTIIDLRYADQFCDKKVANSYICKLGEGEQKTEQEQMFRARIRSVQFRVGLVF